MGKKRVELEIDFHHNMCYVKVDGTTYDIPISGANRYQRHYTANYSMQNTRDIKEKVLDALKEYSSRNPNFTYSKKMLSYVDPLIYNALEFCDPMLEKSYSFEYVKSIIQSFGKSKTEEECRRIRKSVLDECGIIISYGNQEKDPSRHISFFDRLRATKLKEGYERLFGRVKSETYEETDIVTTKKKTESIKKEKENTTTDLSTEKTIEEPGKKETSTIESESKESVKPVSESKKALRKPKKKRSQSESEKHRTRREERKAAMIAQGAATVEKQRKAAEQRKIEEDRKVAEERVLAERKAKEEERRVAMALAIEEKKKQDEQRVSEDSINQKEKIERISEEVERIFQEQSKEEIAKKEAARIARQAKRDKEKKRQDSISSVVEELKRKQEKKSKGIKGLFGIGKTGKKVQETEKKGTQKRFTRSVNSPAEAIQNKRFIKRENIKKFAITGAATLLAAGSLLFSMNVAGNSSNYTVAPTLEQPESRVSEKVENATVSTPEWYTDIDSSVESTVESKAESKSESKVEETQKIKKDTKQNENKDNSKIEKESKSDEEKLKEYKEFTQDKIFESFVIGGDKEQFGDILNDEIFSENPDGTGNIGHFSNFSNYKISHINIVTNKGYITIKENGKSLKEIQDELGDSTRIIDYSIHFANPENNGGYGFVTKSQIEGENGVIKNTIKSISEKKSKTTKSVSDDYSR